MIQKVGVIKTNSNYTLQEDQLYCSLGFPICTRSPQHSRNLSAENITRSMNFVAQAMVNWDLWTIGTCEPKDVTAQMSITLWTQNQNSTSAMISPTVAGKKKGGGGGTAWLKLSSWNVKCPWTQDGLSVVAKHRTRFLYTGHVSTSSSKYYWKLNYKYSTAGK